MTRLTRTIALLTATAAIVGAALSRGPLEARAGVPVISKQAALESIARNALTPAYADLANASARLSMAADAVAAVPSGATLANAQQAWSETLVAWRRTQSFVHGPIADLGIYGRIQFWPSRRQSVDRVLRAQRAFDDTYIQELGANAVGLSALEVLLFDPRQDDAARVAAFSGPQADRQRKYLQALTRELAARTQQVAGAWNGPAGYATTFGAGGQASLNLLVNDMLTAIEAGAQERLRVVIDRRTDPLLRTDLVEGGLSGTSQQGLLALLIGAQAAFAGGSGAGLDDYLRQLKSPTARRVDAQFQKTIAAVRAIDRPLEQAIVTRQQAVTQAQDECRALEIMLKTEVVSTLGVTLTFKSTDGD